MRIALVLNKRKCAKCGHTWISRAPLPQACPACKSYKWKEKGKP
jgi:predicted Zn-ribbon and HTH transcriptional regulator